MKSWLVYLLVLMSLLLPVPGARAQQAAQQGKPNEAGQSQRQAAEALADALGAMQAAAQATSAAE